MIIEAYGPRAPLINHFTRTSWNCLAYRSSARANTDQSITVSGPPLTRTRPSERTECPPQKISKSVGSDDTGRRSDYLSVDRLVDITTSVPRARGEEPVGSKKSVEPVTPCLALLGRRLRTSATGGAHPLSLPGCSTTVCPMPTHPDALPAVAPDAAQLERIRAATELLEEIVADRGLLAHLPVESRARLVQAAGHVYNPDNNARRRMVKAGIRLRRAALVDRAERTLSQTGIRTLRRQPVFGST